MKKLISLVVVFTVLVICCNAFAWEYIASDAGDDIKVYYKRYGGELIFKFVNRRNSAVTIKYQLKCEVLTKYSSTWQLKETYAGATINVAAHGENHAPFNEVIPYDANIRNVEAPILDYKYN